jgi:HEAT repeat protein
LNKQKDNFDQVIAGLKDMNNPFPAIYLHKFSDISLEQLAELKKSWLEIPVSRKINLLGDLEEIAEADTLVCFDDFARFVLVEEKNPQVLSAAIRLLWECEDSKLIPFYMENTNQSDDILRAAAVAALGLFIYLGELDEIPKELQKKIEGRLLWIFNNDPQVQVRRKALESLGYSSRKEVIKIIQKSYENELPEWRASALFAMGRSADPRWKNYILENISEDNPEIKAEAIRAAGQLELRHARPALLELLKEPFELDSDLRSIIIWSLSQIGGKNVRKTLERILAETDDDDEALFIDNALENLDFSESFPELDMLAVRSDEIADEEEFDEYLSDETISGVDNGYGDYEEDEDEGLDEVDEEDEY